MLSLTNNGDRSLAQHHVFQSPMNASLSERKKHLLRVPGTGTHTISAREREDQPNILENSMSTVFTCAVA